MTPIAQRPLADLLASLAAKTPAPGGGATASTAGALAAAQAEMVVAYSIGKKALAEHQDRLAEARLRLERGRALMLALADEDAAAYALLNELQRLPPGDPRRVGLADAAGACVQIPLTALAACVDLLALMTDLVPITNPHLRSDLDIARTLADAAARCCAINVRVNLPTLPDDAAREAAAAETDRLAAKATAQRTSP